MAWFSPSLLIPALRVLWQVAQTLFVTGSLSWLSWNSDYLPCLLNVGV